jgi:formate dehydrogenase beta subunit
MPEVAPRVPGVEARAGKFPGPSLIPALHAIQEREGWLPREELVVLSREVHRQLYEIEGSSRSTRTSGPPLRCG